MSKAKRDARSRVHLEVKNHRLHGSASSSGDLRSSPLPAHLQHFSPYYRGASTKDESEEESEDGSEDESLATRPTRRASSSSSSSSNKSSKRHSARNGDGRRSAENIILDSVMGTKAYRVCEERWPIHVHRPALVTPWEATMAAYGRTRTMHKYLFEKIQPLVRDKFNDFVEEYDGDDPEVPNSANAGPRISVAAVASIQKTASVHTPSSTSGGGGGGGGSSSSIGGSGGGMAAASRSSSTNGGSDSRWRRRGPHSEEMLYDERALVNDDYVMVDSGEQEAQEESELAKASSTLHRARVHAHDLSAARTLRALQVLCRCVVCCRLE